MTDVWTTTVHYVRPEVVSTVDCLAVGSGGGSGGSDGGDGCGCVGGDGSGGGGNGP